MPFAPGVQIASPFALRAQQGLNAYAFVNTRAELNLPTHPTAPGIYEEGIRYLGCKVFVKDEGNEYILRSGITDDHWEVVGTGEATISTWGNGIEYAEGTLVWADNQLWRCKATHTSSVAPATIEDDVANWDNTSSDIFNSTEPTLVSIGGITAGTVLDGYNLTKLIKGLFFPDTPPVLTLTAVPEFGYKEKGVAINGVVLTSVITKGKYPIAPATGAFSQDGTSIEAMAGLTATGGTASSTVAINLLGTTNVEFSAYVEDTNTPTALNNTIAKQYQFVNPVYIGAVSGTTDATTITEADIKACTKRISAPGTNQSMSFTGNNIKFMIAFDEATYGALQNVFEQNGYPVLNTFQNTTVNVTTAANEIVAYKVFVAEIASYPNSPFEISFRF